MKNEVLFDEVGVVSYKNNIKYNWCFKTNEEEYSQGICCAIDELLNCVTEYGDKFRIIIEKVDD